MNPKDSPPDAPGQWVNTPIPVDALKNAQRAYLQGQGRRVLKAVQFSVWSVHHPRLAWFVRLYRRFLSH